MLLAIALLTPATRNRLGTWLVAAAVGAGPVLGYVLTRGPGLPDATDDRGNWGEPLGVASLVVEAILILLALACAAQLRSIRPDRLLPRAQRRPLSAILGDVDSGTSLLLVEDDRDLAPCSPACSPRRGTTSTQPRTASGACTWASPGRSRCC